MCNLRTTILALYCFSAFPSSASANDDTTETTRLFECTLNGERNTVAVDLVSDAVEYYYLDTRGRVELFISSTLQNLDYRPYQWDGNDVTESVTFYNGKTSYRVFGTMKRSGLGLIGGEVGGIVVTAPAGQRIELNCDKYSVEPSNVFHGIARLASLTDENYDAFEQCLSSDLAALACINVHTAACQKDPGDEINCLKSEQSRWLAALADTLSVPRQVGGDSHYSLNGIAEIERAQGLWEASRDADCEVSAWMNYNPFDGSSGQLMCLNEYTARRIDFLNDFALGFEFEG